ncbi:MAG: prepilin-type N-terminal cleavage/methylation domain-containing protein [Pirellulales bacterium]|nr:prepilin-type N-terminal cleavage/methylation domain-containing protein [Pirellulales bacterium]
MNTAHCPRKVSRGYTLVEILVAVALTLAVMAFVVKIFASISRSINDSRTTLEMSSRLRNTVAQLREDLRCATSDMLPPARPDDGKGYFEYREGPLGPVYHVDDKLGSSDPTKNQANVWPKNTDNSGAIVPDSAVLDNDDQLLFTIRTRGEPFVGKTFVKTVGGVYGDPIHGAFGEPIRTAESQVAEVAWFVRGTTLFRLVLLILPKQDVDLRTPDVIEPMEGLAFFSSGTPSSCTFYGNYFLRTKGETDHRSKGFYNNFDWSVRLVYDPANPLDRTKWRLVPNTLADLTKRENRFAHQPDGVGFPFDPHGGLSAQWQYLGLPTLRECSHLNWIPGGPLPVIQLNMAGSPFDAVANPHPYGPNGNPSTADYQDPATGTLIAKGASVPAPDLSPYLGFRVAEDVMLTNVIGFDVKAWDATAPLVASDPAVPPKAILAPGDPAYLSAVDTNTVTVSGVKQVNALGAGAYVDLGYGFRPASSSVWPISRFSGLGNPQSKLVRVFDTWSTHYDHDGLDQDGDGMTDEGSNGFDDVEDTTDWNGDGVVNALDDTDGDGVFGPLPGNRDGIVDDPGESEAPPPYRVPLRGIQITLRVREPDSGQIRTVTIVQDFLPE